MECIVCRGTMPDDCSRCPHCGYPALAAFGPEGQKAIGSYARRWQEERCGGLEVGVLTYRWKASAGGYLPRGSQEFPILKEGRGQDGQIVWMSQPFARTGEMGPLEVTLYLKGKDGKRKERTLSVPRPGTKGFWQVGFRWMEQSKICLLVGEKTSYERAVCDIMEFK